MMLDLATDVRFLAPSLVLVLILILLLVFLVRRRRASQRLEEHFRELLDIIERDSGALILGKNIDHRIFTVGRAGEGYRVSDGSGIVSADLEDVMHRLRWATELTIRKGASLDQGR